MYVAQETLMYHFDEYLKYPRQPPPAAAVPALSLMYQCSRAAAAGTLSNVS